MSNFQTFTLFLLFIFLINIVLSYKSMTVENGELCSPVTKRKIDLGKHDESALLVSQKRLNDHSIEWKVDFKCTFQVKASSHNDGIFAVIQKLILRKNETTNECIDYVQFKRRDGSNSTKYCGYFNAELIMGKHFAPYPFSSDLAPCGNSFIDPWGQLVVTIFVSKEPLIGKETDFFIAFTAYKSCQMSKTSSLPCIPDQKEKCIFSDFFNDSIINCPYPDCVDEYGCSPEESFPPEKVNSYTILLSSLSTLAIMFCIFIIAVYLCRKYSKLCWNQGFATPERSGINLNRNVPVNSPMIASGESQPQSQTSANAPPPEDNKDLPPSYESLFPNR